MMTEAEAKRDTSIEIPAEETNLTVRVGRDGVWLTFRTEDDAFVCLHVHNTLGQPRDLGAATINSWCVERQRQARKIVADEIFEARGIRLDPEEIEL